MPSDHDLLIMSAARLYSLGVDLEDARERLRRLVAGGVPFESLEMLAALTDFQTRNARWKAMEKEHLARRDKLLSRSRGTAD